MCSLVLPLDGFYGTGRECKQCELARKKKKYAEDAEFRARQSANAKRWRDRQPEYRRRQWLRYRFRLSWEDAERMLIEQGGVCALCKQPPEEGKYLSLDHDHDCCPLRDGNDRACGKCYRGFVCTRCNTGLGFFQDDVERLRAAIDYIESYRDRREALSSEPA